MTEPTFQDIRQLLGKRCTLTGEYQLIPLRKHKKKGKVWTRGPFLVLSDGTKVFVGSRPRSPIEMWLFTGRRVRISGMLQRHPAPSVAIPVLEPSDLRLADWLSPEAVAKRPGAVTAMLWDERSGRLVSGNDRGEVMVRGAGEGEPRKRSVGFPIHRLALAPAGDVLAVLGEGPLTLLNAATLGEVRRAPVAEQGAVLVSAAFHPSEPRLYVGTASGFIQVWDTAALKTVASWPAHSGPVAAVTVGRGGSLLASGGWDGEVQLRKTRGEEPATRLGSHAGPVSALAFVSDGQLASGGEDGAVRLAELAAGSAARAMEPVNLDGGISSLAYDAGSGLLCAGGWDGSVRLWSVAQGQLRRELYPEAGPVFDVTCGGEHLRSVHDGGKAIRWSLAKAARGERLLRVDAPERPCCLAAAGDVSAFGFPDGTVRLRGGGAERSVRLFQRKLIQMQLRAGTLAARGRDAEQPSLLIVKALDVATGKVVYATDEKRPVDGFAISSDGRRLAVRFGDKDQLELVSLADGKVVNRLAGAEVQHLDRVFLPGAGDKAVLYGHEKRAVLHDFADGGRTEVELAGVVSRIWADEAGDALVADAGGTIHRLGPTAAGVPQRFRAHSDAVTGLAAAAGVIYAGDATGHLGAWSASGAQKWRLKVCARAVEQLTVSGDKALLLCASGTAKELDLAVFSDPRETD